MLKRVFDITSSSLAIVLASPLLVAVALVLRCTGEGLVVYRQRRIGKGGRTFTLYKFVTMRSDAEQVGHGTATTTDDPRILPVGRMLRKTKINELPQLLNVVKGDMSVVGWRPAIEKGWHRYPPSVRAKLAEIKPGLTGISSVVFRDEERIVSEIGGEPSQVHEQVIAPCKAALEDWYAEHAGLLVDLKIIVATVCLLISPRARVYRRLFPDLPAIPSKLEGLLA